MQKDRIMKKTENFAPINKKKEFQKSMEQLRTMQHNAARIKKIKDKAKSKINWNQNWDYDV